MNTSNSQPEKLEQRMRRSTKSLMLSTFGWVLSLALVAFGPKFLWDYNTVVSVIAISVNVICGVMMIVANKNHLADMDEMQRKIQFEAMAISLGVSMVFGALYGLLEAVKILNHTPNPSNILFVMGISYGIAIGLGYRRYA
ncbi:MAG: hypothetical protein WA981_12660 [Glaciecola sp.]